jgi:hypothetical protein
VDQAYLDDDLPCRVGRLIGNLWSLEWMMRNVLYRLAHAPHTAMPAEQLLFAAKPGDRFPENALTSWDSLGRLMQAYNANTNKPLDSGIVDLRDALAHGRLLIENEAWTNAVLVKLSHPDGGTVSTEARYELTIDWLNDQIPRVGEALDLVKARYRELGGS